MRISKSGLLEKALTVCAVLLIGIPLFFYVDNKVHRERVRNDYITVLVKDLPDIPELQLKDGAFLDLGYRFTSFFDGEWVGITDNKNHYRKLNSDQLGALLKTGKLDKLPPVPPDPALIVIPISLATLALFILAIIAGSLRKKAKSNALARDSSQSSNLLAKMMEAAEKYDKGSGR